MYHGYGKADDIDHLANRRIRCVGELLQNQFRIGLARLERVVRERMTIQDLDVITPQSLINTKPITSSIREFFGSSQLLILFHSKINIVFTSYPLKGFDIAICDFNG